MAHHTAVTQLQSGTWAVVGKSGHVIAEYPNEDAANRAIADDPTPAERAARFGDVTYAATRDSAWEAELISRLNAGLTLSKSDAKLARKLRLAAEKSA